MLHLSKRYVILFGLIISLLTASHLGFGTHSAAVAQEESTSVTIETPINSDSSPPLTDNSDLSQPTSDSPATPITSNSSAGPSATDGDCLLPNTLILKTATNEQGKSDRIRLGDTIHLKIKGLSDAINAKAVRPEALELYFNGYGLTEIQGQYLGSDLLAYQLSRTDGNEEAWKSILSGVWNQTREVSVAIGCPNQGRIKVASDVTLTISLWASWRFAFAGALPIILLSGLILYYWQGAQALIRNPGVTPNRAFSLSRTQFAFWFGLILYSFVIIYGITGDFTKVVSSQAVTLLGFGALTRVGAAIVDNTDTHQLSPQDDIVLQRLLNNRKRLTVEKDPVERRQIENDIAQDLNQMKAIEQQSQNLFLDMFTNAQGAVNLHRFQMVIWTIVLGGIFLYEVFQSFQMPEFDETLLILQGISAATYVTLKTQEEVEVKKEPDVNQKAKSK